MLNRMLKFCLENKLIVTLFLILMICWGVIVAPFDWDILGITRYPIPVDAIPDIGDNQQIVFTRWTGRSPQDIEDQITYPLTTTLLGVSGVKTVRSYSFFGFSVIYIIFKEDVEFYWSRSRILEKFNSLSAGLLPDGVKPSLGPDATALGQVFWYTLEGQDKDGKTTEGWDLHDLRSVQDWYVRYALQSVDGVSEVASIGGFVKEYQIDINPDAMRAYGISLNEIFQAVRTSNIDVGARTIEINRVEYIIRAKGFIKNLEDIENTVVKVIEDVPVYIKNIANVTLGPALRRGALDRGGAEAVGGVVVVRSGENPLAVIKRVKLKIKEISKGLPSKVLSDGRVSQVKVIPFYDRTELIYETLGTLYSALSAEILVTIIVVLIMLIHFRSSLLISGLLPIAVLICFIAMKLFKVDANIVALSGIAIAIGTMVDMGIVLCENILRHLGESKSQDNKLQVIYKASTEVASAILTAILTTVVSFLPVFTMVAAEGKLFKPLAFTKTFALFSSVIVALMMIPPYAYLLFTKKPGRRTGVVIKYLFLVVGFFVAIKYSLFFGVAIILLSSYLFLQSYIPGNIKEKIPVILNYSLAFLVAVLLSYHWLPLGPEKGVLNVIFVVSMIGTVLLFFTLFLKFYERMLKWCLDNKFLFLCLPTGLLVLGSLIWLGTPKVFRLAPGFIKDSKVFHRLHKTFPGLGKEFMPSLDEGAYLFMPTTMPHASIGEALDIIQKQDMAIRSIPEVKNVVGKIGRVDSALDSAPISMIETIVSYHSEYITDKDGYRINYKYNKINNDYFRDKNGNLIQDKNGRPFRQWRAHIKKPDDIWNEIVLAASIPGTTSAPKLQPISARIVMLQSGMRAPMGVKIYGPDQITIEEVGLKIEEFLKEVPLVEANTVIADRMVGKPYLEIEINRKEIARYGISIGQVQNTIEVAIGGKNITTTIEGRERYSVRVRYLRELRDEIESIEKVLFTTYSGAQITLNLIADIKYVPGPTVIKSEDTFLVGYVMFDKKPGYAEVSVVEACQKYLTQKLDGGEFKLPNGVNYKFSGSYESQIRSERKLMIVLPLALFLIFIILYMQFKSISTTLLVFIGVFVAWSGGFIIIWMYGQDWFLNFSVFGVHFRELFQVHPINLSVAVWVGFLALFGIATDDGVVISTYLKQNFDGKKITSKGAIRNAVVGAGNKRVRACLMTTATTILALIPILTSTGRGADVMIPMAIPSFGGMCIELITLFVVPVLYSLIEEIKLKYF